MKLCIAFILSFFAAFSLVAKQKLPEVKLINLVPLQDSLTEYLAKDMHFMEDSGCCTMHVVQMMAIAEGAPLPIDKVSEFADEYKTLLKSAGKLKCPVGIMFHAILGHGKIPNYANIQKIVSVTGRVFPVYCPLDDLLVSYSCDAIKRMAQLKPDFLLIDDDTRLTTGRNGCACPLHLKKLSDKLGYSITREQLYNHLRGTSQEDKKVGRLFDETNLESLASLMQKLRQSVDLVDETMPIIFCQCESDSRFSTKLAKILAGKGNPSVCRINNARYWSGSDSNRTFPHRMYSTAVQIEITKDIDEHLAEIDPHYRNRYATGASPLHALYAMSLIEGCTGAKFWPNTFYGYDPKSAQAYKKLFSKHSKFYNALINETKKVKYNGITGPIAENDFYQYNPFVGSIESYYSKWQKSFGRLGLPVNYARANAAESFMLDASIVAALSDNELKTILSKSAIVDAIAAMQIQKRNMGDLLGVEIAPAKTFMTGRGRLAIPINGIGESEFFRTNYPYELKPLAENVKIMAYFENMDYTGQLRKNCKNKDIPFMSLYKNKLGGNVFVVALNAADRECEPAIMNRQVKALFANALETFGVAKAYYVDDAEIYLKCGDYEDSSLLVCAVNLGLDTENPFRIKTVDNYKTVLMLAQNGEWENVDHSRDGNIWSINTNVETMMPAFFKFVK